MKNIFTCATLLLCFTAQSQLITMGNKCYNKIQEAKGYNKSQKYIEALNIYEEVSKSCKAKDAKIAIAIGKSTSLNGLKRYDDALAAADDAINLTKSRNVEAYFQRAVANEGLNNAQAAQDDFNTIISITEKNKNIKSRATIYAKIADMQWQDNKKEEALKSLQQATDLDPTNADFVIQRGDMKTSEGKFDEAFENYDKAVSLGRNDLEMYKIRTSAAFKMMQEKYNTKEASVLKSKMSAKEKEALCRELKKSLEMGLRDPNLSLFAAMVCE